MGAFGPDGTKYMYLAKNHQMVVLKDGYKLVLDTQSSQAQIFQKDKNGVYVLKKPDAKDIPKGWKIDGDSVFIDGNALHKRGEQVLKLLGVAIDLNEHRLNMLGADNKVVASTDGTTVTTSPDRQIKVEENGKVEVSDKGKPVLVADTNANTAQMIAPDGSTTQIAADGSVDTKDATTNQSAHIEASGAVQTFDAQKNPTFSMNSMGDMQLADGTQISHTGAVVNYSRGINEPSFNGKTASEVVQETALKAASAGSFVTGVGGLGSSIASLEAMLSTLDQLGDVPGMAEQIGAAKGNIRAAIAEAKQKESLTDKLAHAGKDCSTIEGALKMRGCGTSDDEIAQKILAPQTAQALQAQSVA